MSTTTVPRVTTSRAPHTDDDHGWPQLIEAVRETGLYPTRTKADQVTRTVIDALGTHVTGDERVDIAATHRLTAARFVDEVASRTPGATSATARWDVSSVLGALPPLIGDDLVTRILAQLPAGYALLFGRADLTPAS